MKAGKPGGLLAGVTALLLLMVTAQAVEAGAFNDYGKGATRKLGRGLANVATAPLELIRTPYFVEQRDGGLASITVGIVQGVGAVVIRELAGIVETVTFPIPLPKRFAPLIEPEFVYAHGDWAPPVEAQKN